MGSMRKSMVVLVGLALGVGLLLHPRPTGAVNSCSVSGDYRLSGFALGDTEVVGSLAFTPNSPCAGGTFTGSVTVRQGGNPPVSFVPAGTYVVNPDATMTITNTGGVTVTLQAIVSQVVNDLANAIHVVGDVGGAINVGLTLTAAVLTGAVSGNTANAIVQRDGTGSFSAGSLTLVGDLHLPATSSSAAGVLTLSGHPFLHAFGTSNTFLGDLAGNFSMTGTYNTAVGASALVSNTTGTDNTAVGANALVSNTTGDRNTAVGDSALFSNTTGSHNTAVGTDALVSTTTGGDNTAVGANALDSNTTGGDNTAVGTSALRSTTIGAANTAVGTDALVNSAGSNNIALGNRAGWLLASGNHNIYIGELGEAAESATIRIGTGGTHTRAFIAGIRGVTTGVANAVAVLIDSAGQLGTVSSSRRAKSDIEAMGAASAPLLRLRPVSFRYTAQAAQGPRQYGLIAEEVAEIFPDLVVYDQTGQPETVRYHELPALLLNELQQQHRRLAEQAQTIAVLEVHLAQLERLLAVQASP